jgi:hypothetical protein
MGFVDLVKSVVFRVQDPALITIDTDAITKNARKGVDAVDKINAAKRAEENAGQEWRIRLDELNRRLQGAITESQARRHASEQDKKHAAAIGIIEKEIAEFSEALASPDLELCKSRRQGAEPRGGCGCDACVLTRKQNALKWDLFEAKKASERSIRLCAGLIRDAAANDKLRPEWKSLSQRAAKIRDLRLRAGNKQDKPFGQQPINSNEMVVHDLGLKSPHLRWEK